MVAPRESPVPIAEAPGAEIALCAVPGKRTRPDASWSRIDSDTRRRWGFLVASPSCSGPGATRSVPGGDDGPSKGTAPHAEEDGREDTRSLGGASAWRCRTEPAPSTFGAPTGPRRTKGPLGSGSSARASVEALASELSGPLPGPLTRSCRNSPAGREVRLSPGGPGRLSRGRILQAVSAACKQASPAEPNHGSPEGSAILGDRHHGQEPSGRDLWRHRADEHPDAFACGSRLPEFLNRSNSQDRLHFIFLCTI